MLISDFSFWGIFATVTLLMCVIGLFFITDRRLMSRLLRVLLYVSMSLAVVALLSWGLLKLTTWWGDLIWTILLTVSVSYFTLRKARLSLRPFFLPLSGSLLIAVGIGFSCLFLLVKVSHTLLVLSVLAVFFAQVIQSVSLSLRTYVSSLRHTQEHCQYLLANGATHVESIMPCVRRSLRASILPSLHVMTAPIILAPPLFYCGLILCGSSPLASAVITLVVMIVGLFVPLLTTLLTIMLVDRFLFDASGRFIY